MRRWGGAGGAVGRRPAAHPDPQIQLLQTHASPSMAAGPVTRPRRALKSDPDPTASSAEVSPRGGQKRLPDLVLCGPVAVRPSRLRRHVIDDQQAMRAQRGDRPGSSPSHLPPGASAKIRSTYHYPEDISASPRRRSTKDGQSPLAARPRPPQPHAAAGLAGRGEARLTSRARAAGYQWRGNDGFFRRADSSKR